MIPTSLLLKIGAVAVVTAAAGWGVWSWNDRAWQRGYDARVAQEVTLEREKTDAANRAGDDADRCSRDADCRLRDDGFKRD